MSNRDSMTSTTSRFSSLLSTSTGGGGSSGISSRPSSSLSSTMTATTATATSSQFPPSVSVNGHNLHPDTRSIGSGGSTVGTTTASGIGYGSGGGGKGKRENVIYDRPLTRTRGAEVNLGAWNFLFGEIVQYTQKQVTGISEFEKRLNILGYRVGSRLLELLAIRDSLYPITSTLSRSPPPPTRQLRLLPLLTYIHSNLYRYLFGKVADSLEKSTENSDEYMIGDDDMVIIRNVKVPKEMKELSCAALVAGIVEAVMDGTGFPARVTAHSVPTEQHPRRTVLLIKLDPQVLQREEALSGPSNSR